MFAISSVLGAKYYPIPYRWGRLAGLFLLMGAVYGGSMLLDSVAFASVSLPSGEGSVWPFVAKLGSHTVLIGAYLAGAWYIIRKK